MDTRVKPAYDTVPASARLDAVADRAETGECVGPGVARRTGDDAQHRTTAAESEPLHHAHRCILLAADRIQTGLVARRAIDADRLGHRELGIAQARDRRRDLLRKAA